MRLSPASISCLLWASLWLVLVFVFVYFFCSSSFYILVFFSLVRARSNNFLFMIRFLSFHSVFVYQGLVFLLLPSLFPCAALHTPLPACPFICYCLGPDWLPSLLKLFWTAAKLCAHLECQYVHSNGQSEARELPRNSNQLEPIVFDNKLCQ